MQGAATPNAPLSQLPTTNLNRGISEGTVQVADNSAEREPANAGAYRSIPMVTAGSLFECQYTVFSGERNVFRGGMTSVVDSLPETELAQPIESTVFEECGVDAVKVVEHSLLWQTTGKGERDFGILLFERRRVPKPTAGQTLVFPGVHVPAVFRAVSPIAPLSYHGKLISIEWLVRVRVFLLSGRQLRFEQCFALVTE